MEAKQALYAVPVTLVADANANDSDKTFTVPADRCWEPISLYATLATSADQGDRQFALDFQSGSQIVYRVRAAAVQTGSTTEYYFAAQGDKEPSETVAHFHYMSMPPRLVLRPGWTIRVWDASAVAATADDLTVVITVIERSQLLG
jgi:hypothetical protein